LGCVAYPETSLIQNKQVKIFGYFLYRNRPNQPGNKTAFQQITDWEGLSIVLF